MQLTGTNILYTPRLSVVNYYFNDIIVDSTGLYEVKAAQYHNTSGVALYTGDIFKLKNGKVLDRNGRFLSSYNLNEKFSISGWINYSNQSNYISIGNNLSETTLTESSSGRLGELIVKCPGTYSFSSDIVLQSNPITSSASFNSFQIYSNLTGEISSSASMFLYNDSVQFYNSYEQLFTGEPVIAFIDSRYPIKVVYKDNDASSSDNALTFDYKYDTTYGQQIFPFVINRTGLYNSGVFQLVDSSLSSGFSGLFNGSWSGNQFVYSDVASSNSYNYFLSLSDPGGNVYPISCVYNVSIPSTGTSMKAEYVTGFELTSSGEYSGVPILNATQYYYCEGIQQSINSMLFSSGCTGDLDVSFTGFDGAGASGLLKLNLTTFRDVYGAGINKYNVVYDYVHTHIGTGYKSAPTGLVNTGKYGSACFDVPLVSGYNEGWFRPFTSLGSTSVQAGWFTGVALCDTGLLQNGSTGYVVTGIDVYNIGVGYSQTLPPTLTFIRTGSDGLTSGASGVLHLKDSAINLASNWRVEGGIAGYTTSLTGFSGEIPLVYENDINIIVYCSGIDITENITGVLTVCASGNGEMRCVDKPISYNKYFDTGTTFLKKNNSVIETFSITEDLSFAVTQSELDLLYSGAGYTSNSWPFEEGDFDF